MDRLDHVLGCGNWQTHYREVKDGVLCTLRCRIADEWIEHEDVGGFSDQADAGDRLKASVSDSLKRAAVHLGVGRYLYRLPGQWVGWNPQKREFIDQPALPSWALPAGLTAEQEGVLVRLIADTKSNRQKLLEYFQAPRLADLTAAQFNRAVQMLGTKAKQHGGKPSVPAKESTRPRAEQPPTPNGHAGQPKAEVPQWSDTNLPF